MSGQDQHERWAPLPGYGDHYEVSDMGSVRSKDRVSTDGSRRKGRLLTPTGLNYLHVTLSADGRKVQRYVHRLVLESFVGPAPEGARGCHRNDVPTDNRLTNLNWGSAAENMEDAVANGRISRPRRVLTPDEVREIRLLIVGGRSTRSIANDYGIARSSIVSIAAGRTWKHVH